jgi:tRNA threonylcarbamoyladenosine biosynthesis protein TsaE
MTKKRMEIITHSPEETKKLGQMIGKQLKLGVVITLTGDLGSGKTVFVQGLARGLDVPDHYYITSPTFTLINKYPGRHSFYHVDLYRIETRDDLEEIGFYEILAGDGITAIEWADRLRENDLDDHMALHFEILDDESRKIFMTAYGLEEINLIWKAKNQIEERR